MAGFDDWLPGDRNTTRACAPPGDHREQLWVQALPGEAGKVAVALIQNKSSPVCWPLEILPNSSLFVEIGRRNVT